MDPIALLNAALEGRYFIEREIGRGGMGVVYLAEQQEPVQRQVALKVVETGHQSEQLLARFETERQALAVMDHPSVAKVFDAGVSTDGRPWFAMEYVGGVGITDFCDDARLSIEQRLRLFTDVCRAVQHAHLKGLIHRDLKPSNVLVAEVDGRPLPKIIDFGIAKVEQPDFVGERLTQIDQVIGTPEYMSPEQIDGSQDIDTRSDVYSLGVLLYELLTGTLPFDPSAYRGWASLAAAIHRDPPSPTERFASLSDTQETVAGSRRTTPSALRRALRGDLDFIVARATDKDREHRYETASGLALDIERFLASQPVRSTGASAVYVLGKFVRRHRVGVAFSVTGAVGLAAFALTTAIQANRIAEARDDAEARRDQAEQLIDFMLTDVREKLEPLGRLDILDEVGDQAVRYFSSLPESSFTDQELLSRSQALYQIGSVRLAQGRLPDAQVALVESLRLARDLRSRDPSNNEWLFGLGQSEFWVGDLFRRQSRLAEARQHFEQYRDLSRELLGREPANLTYQLEVGYSHTNLGVVLISEGEAEAAVSELREALSIKQEVSRADPQNGRWAYAVSTGHNILAVGLRAAGRWREALGHFRLDVAIKGQLLDVDPQNSKYRDRLAASMDWTAGVHEFLGNADSARVYRKAAMESFEALAFADPSNARLARNKAFSRLTYGMLLAEGGDNDGGTRYIELAHDELRSLAESNRDQVQWRMDVVDAWSRRASVAVVREDWGAARSFTDSTNAVLESLLGDRPDLRGATSDSFLRAQMLVVSGQIHSGQEKPEAAESDWREAVDLMAAKVEGSKDPELLELYLGTLLLLQEEERAGDALDTLRSMGYAKSLPPWLEKRGG